MNKRSVDGRRQIALLASVTGLLLVIAGCGVKAPPVAPQEKTLSAVGDLSAILAGDAIVLQWSDPKGRRDIAGYDIYARRTDVNQAPCLNCPEHFEKWGVLSLKGQNDSGPSREYRLTPAPGFRYHFKVSPFLVTGAQGPGSNVTVIDGPK